jgi:hypothetical protein
MHVCSFLIEAVKYSTVRMQERRRDVGRGAALKGDKGAHTPEDDRVAQVEAARLAQRTFCYPHRILSSAALAVKVKMAL